MTRTNWLFLAAALLACPACEAAGSASQADASPPCATTLALANVWAPGQGCPAAFDGVAGDQPCGGTSETRYTGTCGGLRVLLRNHGTHEALCFYAPDSGVLVAVRSSNATASFCGGTSSSIEGGTVPKEACKSEQLTVMEPDCWPDCTPVEQATLVATDTPTLPVVAAVLARRVADELYMDLRITDHPNSWTAKRWLQVVVRAPVPAPGNSLSVPIGGAALAHLAYLEKTDAGLASGTFPAENSSLAGCLHIAATGTGYTADLRLDAMLQVVRLGGQPAQKAVAASARAAWTHAETKALTPYAGECTGYSQARYVPDQTGYGQDADFDEWTTEVEPSCSQATGC